MQASRLLLSSGVAVLFSVKPERKKPNLGRISEPGKQEYEEEGRSMGIVLGVG
jgi:hypothetical protein